MKIFVQHHTGQVFDIHIDESDTIHKLKTLIQPIMNLDVQDQRLIFKIIEIVDHKLIKDYNIKENNKLYLVEKLK